MQKWEIKRAKKYIRLVQIPLLAIDDRHSHISGGVFTVFRCPH
jgi:hypothetical protein